MHSKMYRNEGKCVLQICPIQIAAQPYSKNLKLNIMQISEFKMSIMCSSEIETIKHVFIDRTFVKVLCIQVETWLRFPDFVIYPTL